MPLETVQWIGDLVATNPPDTDPRSQGAAHLRNIKAALLDSFPGCVQMIIGAGVATGTANAMHLALSPDPGAPVDGGAFLVKAVGENTVSNPTLQINSQGAVRITKSGGLALTIGDIVTAGQWILLAYNGTSATLDLLNPATGVSGTPMTISGDTTLTSGNIATQSFITATANITLPAGSTVIPYQSYRFKSMTFGNVRLTPNGSDTIEGVNAAFRVPAWIQADVMWTGSGWVMSRGNESYVGESREFSGASVPIGWQLEDGSALSQATYAGLFAVIGSTFGASGGNFNVPDHRGRLGLGVSGSHALGTTGGAETHAMGPTEMPAHTHTVASQTNPNPGSGGALMVSNSGGNQNTSTTSAGSGAAFNIMNPFVAKNFIIKL